MDSRRLAIFLAVVDEGGFTAAGDALDLSQPAVSQAIRELEDDLGAVLFHRLGRAVKLTPAGEALVLPARQARQDLAIGRSAVEEIAGLGAGRLDLACLPTLAVAPLAPLVGAFRVAYPGVSVRLSDPEDTAETAAVHPLGALRSRPGRTSGCRWSGHRPALESGVLGGPPPRDHRHQPFPSARPGRASARPPSLPGRGG